MKRTGRCIGRRERSAPNARMKGFRTDPAHVEGVACSLGRMHKIASFVFTLMLSILVLIVFTSSRNNITRAFRRANTCVAPNLDSSTLEVLNRTRRLAVGRPTCEQVTNAANVQRVAQILGGEAGWESLFPLRHGSGQMAGTEPYTYQNFLTAVAQWPEFCSENVGPFFPDVTPDVACRTELATVFANMAQEVGAHIPQEDEANNLPEWRQGLYYLSELGCTNDNEDCRYGLCSGWQDEAYPCADGKGYFGRGPYQLSWNYNYGSFSISSFGDVTALLDDPDKILDDGWLAFASAIWFFMTPQPPKPSGHDVVYGHFQPNQADVDAGRSPGFGVQIMLINGALECGASASSSNAAKAQTRESYFVALAEYFGVQPGSNTDCTAMLPFDASSAAAIASYWDSSAAANDCECRVVSWDTGDSIFDHPSDLDRSYCRCVGQKYTSEECPGVGGTLPAPFAEGDHGAQNCDLGGISNASLAEETGQAANGGSENASGTFGTPFPDTNASSPIENNVTSTPASLSAGTSRGGRGGVGVCAMWNGIVIGALQLIWWDLLGKSGG